MLTDHNPPVWIIEVNSNRVVILSLFEEAGCEFAVYDAKKGTLDWDAREINTYSNNLFAIAITHRNEVERKMH